MAIKDIKSLSERFAYKASTATSSIKSITHKISKPQRFRSYKYHISEVTYAHLSPLPDLLQNDLKLVFCGFNPGIKSAELGHRFAHRSNCFWPLLYQSGIVPDPLTFEDDISMPERYNIGFTELVMRPTKGVEEIPTQELKTNVPRLLDTINKYRPKVLCLVGRGIWDAIARTMKIDNKNFKWGLQEQSVFKCKLFVVPSTSGLVRIKHEDKLETWRDLKKLIDKETGTS
ncbi:G/U mismatch-specific DNA glycosylase [Cyberlindnera fabianii]|uniref:G/U mismatch-specific DNA glycosylase n=1 Tax=Cyberlindnera fabianii TaxID=36022 RepID=A0A1V2L3Z0_CYBFA|nr:G/U mismatch-specific DNA glycosylase [Cyberlindnera fabianii]